MVFARQNQLFWRQKITFSTSKVTLWHLFGRIPDSRRNGQEKCHENTFQTCHFARPKWSLLLSREGISESRRNGQEKCHENTFQTCHFCGPKCIPGSYKTVLVATLPIPKKRIAKMCQSGSRLQPFQGGIVIFSHAIQHIPETLPQSRRSG